MFDWAKEKVLLLFGNAPSCEWARMRFAAYYAWDTALSKREFQAIEQHLIDCPECAAEYQAVHEVRNAFERKLAAADPRMMSTEELVERTMARIHAAEADNVQLFTRKSPAFQRKAAWAAAAACLVMLAAPVLAYVGAKVFQAPEPSAPIAEDIIVSQVQETQVPTTTETNAPVLSGAAEPLGDTDFLYDDSFIETIDGQLQQTANLAMVEAMLPHTEDEYEQWARKEYPHIMWLYDILMGEIPKRSADSPAARLLLFGTTDDGNPTITLPDAGGHMVTLCVAVPHETGTLPNESAAADETEPPPSSNLITLNGPSVPWDGIPTDIPDWGQRLYAGTPESDRPTGWRALVIYSGEILKLDWPGNLDEANCLPSLDAVQAAAAISGLGADSDGALCEPEAGTFEVTIALGPQVGYVDALATDVSRANSLVIYIHASALVVGAPEFDELSVSANAVLGTLYGARKTDCTLPSAVKARALADLLESRRRQIVGGIGSD